MVLDAIVCWLFFRFFDSVVAIQKNHPYLGGMSLTKHAENGTLYVVDLTEVTLNEETVSLK